MTMTSDDRPAAGHGLAAWTALARRSAKRGAGVAMVGTVAVLALSLAGWHVNDPSWSVATAEPVRNWLGAPGAIVADLLMQTMGLGALVLLLVPLWWGYGLWRGDAAGTWRSWPPRLCWWLAAIALASAALCALPQHAAWPLPTGLGGIAGELAFRPFRAMGLVPGSWLAVTVAIPLAVAARIAVAYAGSLRTHDEDEDGGRLDMAIAVTVGTLGHWWLTTRAVLARASAGLNEERARRDAARLRAQADRAAASEPPFGDVSFDEGAYEPSDASGNPAHTNVPARPVEHPVAPAGTGHDAPHPAAAHAMPMADLPLPHAAPVVEAPRHVRPDPASLAFAPEPFRPYLMPAPIPAEWSGVPIEAVSRDVPLSALADPSSVTNEWSEERMRLHGLLPRGRAAQVGDTLTPATAAFAEPGPDAVADASAPGAALYPAPVQAWETMPGAMAMPVDAAVATPLAAPRPTVRVPAQSQRVTAAPAPAAATPPAAPGPFRATAPQHVDPAPQGAVPAPQGAVPAPQPATAPVPIREAPAGAPDVFTLPPLEYLKPKGATVQDASLSPEALRENAAQLESVLADFGVKGQIIDVKPGPVVTLYELEPAPGTKSSRVIGLAEDIARSMSAIAARVAVVPGRNAIGIELPNATREMVMLREIVELPDFKASSQKLALTLGKDIGGVPVVADLAKMPHLLVAGTTGSGKSVAINTMILSLLYRLTPAECRLIMIDPKMLELSVYDGIPHLLSPVVTDPKKAVVALKWCVREMEERYKKMAKLGVRNVGGFNDRVKEAAAAGETLSRTVQTGFDRETGEAIYETEEMGFEPMPFIVVIIDEMADLMMVAGKDIEGLVQRLAQMARAAGIHVVMATQRPSVDVITGTIKANFPTRISFQVTSKIDSRTILGEMGAEQLLGMGDMLYMAAGGRTKRVHGPFVSDGEVEEVVAYLKTQGVPDYLEDITVDDEEEAEDEDDTPVADHGEATGLQRSDDPYDQAVALVLRDGKASTSYVQRRLGIGYNRAATIIERMELEGVISAPNAAGKREVLLQGGAGDPDMDDTEE